MIDCTDTVKQSVSPIESQQDRLFVVFNPMMRQIADITENASFYLSEHWILEISK